MTDFILIKCFKVDPEDETKLRKAQTTLACFLAIFDIYTDINTVYTLYTSQEDNLCSYNCPAVLATTLCAFILYSMIEQARYVYSAYKNKLYAFLSLLGYGPVVIALDMWDEIGTNDKKFRRFFRIRWMETTLEALPAAAIQIVVLLFFSTSLADAQEVSSLIEIQRLQSTILIFISIILSLWSVGNGTRKYCAFIGKFNKPIWYYYCLAFYTATDMFNRSLILSLFFVSLLDVTQFDVYMIVVVVAVVVHQILFTVIDKQRIPRGEGKGTDRAKGSFGEFLNKNIFIFSIFILFYMVMPSSVVFLRNFHVKDAKISFWVIWFNGIGYIFAGILFFILRVVFNNKLNILYTSGVIYLMSFNLLPYILVLYGRLKTRSKAELAEMPLKKQLTITMEQMNLNPDDELYNEDELIENEQTLKIDVLDTHKTKLQKVKEEEQRLKQLKAEEIRKKNELKAKRLQELQEKERELREQKKKEREIKDKAIRVKKKAEDEKARLEYEKKEREKAKRLEQRKIRKNTNNRKDTSEYDKTYDPRMDDDMVSTGSEFSAFAINMGKNNGNKNEKRKSKHKKTLSDVISENKENEYEMVDNTTPVETSENPKWSLFGSGKKSEKPLNSSEKNVKKGKHKKTMSTIETINENKENEYEAIGSSTPIDGGNDKAKWSLFGSGKRKESNTEDLNSEMDKNNKKKNKKNRANSDQLRDSATAKRKELKMKTNENKKKLKLDKKSVSVQQKSKRKKKVRSSSLTPMSKKDKEAKMKKIQKMKLKNVKSSDKANENENVSEIADGNDEQKPKKKTST